MKFLWSLFDQKRMVGGTLVLGITQLLASVAGLVRDRTLAITFPQLDTVDIYIASFRLSDLLFQMFIMAGFSVALVPLLSQYKVKNNTQGMLDLMSGIMNVAAVFFGVIAIIIAIFFSYIAPFITNFTGDSLQLYITYGRLALLTNFLFIFGNAFGQYLLTIQRYFWYGLTPILYSLGTIFGTLFLSGTFLFGQLGPMVGTLIGAMVYVVIRFAAVLISGGTFRLRFWHTEVKEVIIMMLPRTVALGTLQLQLLLFDMIASGLDTGSVTINAYARNFQSVVVGAVGIAVAQSAFALLSQSIALHDIRRFWIYMKKGIIVMSSLTIPGAITLAISTPIAARLVGISTFAYHTFAICLLLYACSIPFESLNHLLLRGYYAARQTFIPSLFSVFAGCIAIFISWYFTDIIGIYSLPVGFTCGQVFLGIVLGILLPKTVTHVHV